VFLSVIAAACAKNGPSDAGVSAGQAIALADALANVTMAALVSGGAQVGLNHAGHAAEARGGGPAQAAPGQVYGTALCPAGGQVRLIYREAFNPGGGFINGSVLRAVYEDCAFNNGGASLAFSGELSLSGQYRGTSEPSTITVSGSLTTPAGACAVDGAVGVTGSFSGTACGTSAQTTPTPTSPAAVAAVGTYTLRTLGGAGLPVVSVTQPCIGFIDAGALSLGSDGKYVISMPGHFECSNGPGPVLQHSENGMWAVLAGGTIVFSPTNTLFKPSSTALNGGAMSFSVDVPSDSPNIPPTRMTAVFSR
jgi:hypothetical protein